MTIPASTVPQAAALLQTRTQLQSRIAQIGSISSLQGMAGLFAGTGLESGVLNIATTQVATYLQNQIAALEAQLTAMGVDLEA